LDIWELLEFDQIFNHGGLVVQLGGVVGSRKLAKTKFREIRW